MLGKLIYYNCIWILELNEDFTANAICENNLLVCHKMKACVFKCFSYVSEEGVSRINYRNKIDIAEYRSVISLEYIHSGLYRGFSCSSLSLSRLFSAIHVKINVPFKSPTQ